jgi:hypothetical protein
LSYDFNTREGLIHFPAGAQRDMRACIDLCKAIDPDVQAIITMVGGGQWMLYRRGKGPASQEWQAIDRKWRRRGPV